MPVAVAEINGHLDPELCEGDAEPVDEISVERVEWAGTAGGTILVSDEAQTILGDIAAARNVGQKRLDVVGLVWGSKRLPQDRSPSSAHRSAKA